MRGKGDEVAEQAAQYGITPAYAGKRVNKFHDYFTSRDHPRVCGEKDFKEENKMPKQGSPPRMRGKGFSKTRLQWQTRITPAYAGKSFTGIFVVCSTSDHPRVCGEKSVPTFSETASMGSPPRMRGKGKGCLAHSL